LGGLPEKDVGILNGNLVNFTSISNSKWPFGIFIAIWYTFSRFGMLCQEKSGNPVAVCSLHSVQSGMTALFAFLQ
jgi:hypothetical protein